jgi:SAM-dependent methyltransferase
LTHRKDLQASRQFWDGQAPAFDDEPDHGLRDPLIRETWTAFLRESLPSAAADVLDIGCGTGSLSVVLAGLGHRVTGVDLSPSMISLAREKAAASGSRVAFQVMDAAWPDLPGRQFDAILCRHLLWTLPEPADVLQRWAALLRPQGRLILIEGFWGTGAGLHAGQIVDILPDGFARHSLRNLAGNPTFWGREVDDERYAILAERSQ